LYRKLPGIPPATFSMVDARDVAEAMWPAAQKARRGERYRVAGRHMSMGHLFQKLEQVSGIAAARWNVPLPVLHAMAAANEIWAGITKRSAFISLATVRLTSHERERTRFNHEKSGENWGFSFDRSRRLSATRSVGTNRTAG
jgi:dihydroflavonol-4-reductase